MTSNKITGFTAVLVSIPIILTILSFSPAVQAQTVSAQISRVDSTKVIVDITIARPAPSSLIMEMRLPPGIAVIGTRPAASKIKKDANDLKWLFKDVQPGKMLITVVTDRSFSIENSSVVLRYRNKQNQEFFEISASIK